MKWMWIPVLMLSVFCLSGCAPATPRVSPTPQVDTLQMKIVEKSWERSLLVYPSTIIGGGQGWDVPEKSIVTRSEQRVDHDLPVARWRTWYFWKDTEPSPYPFEVGPLEGIGTVKPDAWPTYKLKEGQKFLCRPATYHLYLQGRDGTYYQHEMRECVFPGDPTPVYDTWAKIRIGSQVKAHMGFSDNVVSIEMISD